MRYRVGGKIIGIDAFQKVEVQLYVGVVLV